MRLTFFTLFAFSASLFSFFPTLISAIHPHTLTRRDHKRSPTSQVLNSRQHRVARDLLDVCINVNVDLLADASQLLGLGGLLGPLDLGSKIQLCLCLKDLDIYLDTNDDIQALIGLLGKDTISALIIALINTSPDAQQCTFPTHAHHTCNNSDPCHYECDPGYVQDGDMCVCAPPNISCNGVCGSFPQGCGSAVPHAKKVRTGPIVTLAQAEATCKPHQSVCGIPGRENTLAFECIDTTGTTDSCGGCLVPHPFSEAEPVRHTSGADCGNIPNVEMSSCSEKRCIVHACKEGWQPNSANDNCIPDISLRSRMRKITKRSDPVSVNAAADANINPDLVSQLVVIVDMVLSLPSGTASNLSSVPTSSNPSTSSNALSALLRDINDATRRLLKSSRVSELLFNVDVLLDTCFLMGSMLHDCGCAEELGLSDVSRDLEDLMAATADLQSWCAHNPIVPISNGALMSSTPSSSNPSDQSIVVGLTDLLNSLGQHGKSGVFVDDLGNSLTDTSNKLLNGLNLDPNNDRRDDTIVVHANVTVNSDLLTKIVALVNLVVDIRGDLASLPDVSSSPHPTQSPNAISSLVTPIVQATIYILDAKTVPLIISAIDSLINTTVVASGLLNQCGCVDALGLDSLLADLEKIVDLGLDMQTWCHSHPVAIRSPSSWPTPASAKPPISSPVNSTIANTDDLPIVVGLSDLLAGLVLLAPVTAGAAIDGLGSGLSSSANGLLNGLNIGPLNFKRREAPPVSANATGSANINSDLVAQLEALVDLALGVPRSMGSVSSDGSSSSEALLDSTLVTGLVQTTANLLQSPTISALLANIDALISAGGALQDRIAGCGCMESPRLEQAAASLVRLIEAALALQSWCLSNPIVTSPLSLLPIPSGLLLVTDSPQTLPIATAMSHTAVPVPSIMSKPAPSASSHSIAPVWPSAKPGSLLPAASITQVLFSSVHVQPTRSLQVPSQESSDLNDIPIILRLDHLLSRLGFGDIERVATVEGLGNGLSGSTNGLLDGLRIGPSDVRRQSEASGLAMKRQELMRERDQSERRQIVVNATATVLVDSDLLVQINALIDLVLGLNTAGMSFPPASTPSLTVTTYPTLTPTRASIPSGVPSSYPPGIDSSLIDSIISATTTLLSCTTYEELLAETDALVSASILSLKVLEGCGCLQDLGLFAIYSYLLKIVDAALGLQDWCHANPMPSAPSQSTPPSNTPSGMFSSSHVASAPSASPTQSNDETIVVGLAKLLNGLGLDLKADVVVDSLGNGPDHTVKPILNDLGIGSNGARRRFIRAVRDS